MKEKTLTVREAIEDILLERTVDNIYSTNSGRLEVLFRTLQPKYGIFVTGQTWMRKWRLYKQKQTRFDIKEEYLPETNYKTYTIMRKK